MSMIDVILICIITILIVAFFLLFKYIVDINYNNNTNVPQICPEIPRCPECPDCKLECPSYENSDDSVMIGIKLKTKSSTIKKLVKKINKMTKLWIQPICLEKESIKKTIDESIDDLDKSTIDSIECDSFLIQLKENLEAEFANDDNLSVPEEFKNEILSIIIEIAELIIPDEVCKNNKPNLKYIKSFLYDIIDALCDPFDIDE